MTSLAPAAEGNKSRTAKRIAAVKLPKLVAFIIVQTFAHALLSRIAEPFDVHYTRFAEPSESNTREARNHLSLTFDLICMSDNPN